MPRFPYRWRVATARVRAVEGDLDNALELIEEAERFYVSDFFPNVRPVAALKARLWIANSQLRDAFGWARQAGLSVNDELSHLREYEHITLARLLLAQAKTHAREPRCVTHSFCSGASSRTLLQEPGPAA